MARETIATLGVKIAGLRGEFIDFREETRKDLDGLSDQINDKAMTQHHHDDLVSTQVVNPIPPTRREQAVTLGKQGSMITVLVIVIEAVSRLF